MSWISDALTSSIGRKLAMSLTGLFLVSFLFVHLSGNFLLFKSDNGEAFNLYSHFMSTAGIIRILEIFLVAGFGLHIYTAVVLTRKNAAARPVEYAAKGSNKKVTWFSKNMGLSGSIVLVFLILHLQNFYWRYHNWDIPMVEIDGESYKDMYFLVASVFKNEWWVNPVYLLGLLLLGFHLQHGFASAFNTLGLEHNKYSPLISRAGTLISILVPLGFATMPLYFWLFY
jgi:succinate dehydrogenase / fumarate reductase cytochrome b subunit